MSKYTVKQIWESLYGSKQEVYDYAGRLMLKSACGNPNSSYQPTIDHIRPLACGGKDTKANIILCHYETNIEKADHFPHWKSNDQRFHAERTKNVPNGYTIIKER